MGNKYRYIDDIKKGIYPRDNGFEQYREIMSQTFEDEIKSEIFNEKRSLTEISNDIRLCGEEDEPNKENVRVFLKRDKTIYRINNTFYLQEGSCFIAIDFQHGLKLIKS